MSVNVCQCEFFGHVHQFRSYSFGHVKIPLSKTGRVPLISLLILLKLKTCPIQFFLRSSNLNKKWFFQKKARWQFLNFFDDRFWVNDSPCNGQEWIPSQKVVNFSCCLSALSDGPDDQGLAASAVPGSKDALNSGAELALVGLDVAPDILDKIFYVNKVRTIN